MLLCLCMTVAIFPAAVFASVTRVEYIPSDVYTIYRTDDRDEPEKIDNQAGPVKTVTQVEPEIIDISATTDIIDPNDRTVTLTVNNADVKQMCSYRLPMSH